MANGEPGTCPGREPRIGNALPPESSFESADDSIPGPLAPSAHEKLVATGSLRSTVCPSAGKPIEAESRPTKLTAAENTVPVPRSSLAVASNPQAVLSATADGCDPLVKGAPRAARGPALGVLTRNRG